VVRHRCRSTSKFGLSGSPRDVTKRAWEDESQREIHGFPFPVTDFVCCALDLPLASYRGSIMYCNAGKDVGGSVRP
jgi:hypothetical protein